MLTFLFYKSNKKLYIILFFFFHNNIQKMFHKKCSETVDFEIIDKHYFTYLNIILSNKI